MFGAQFISSKSLARNSLPHLHRILALLASKNIQSWQNISLALLEVSKYENCSLAGEDDGVWLRDDLSFITLHISNGIFKTFSKCAATKNIEKRREKHSDSFQ